jgi:hypothetical protein
MSATVIEFWHGAHADRIRIPGPGETFAKPAAVLAFPDRRRTELKPTPRRRARPFDDDERRAEPIGPGDKEAAAPVKT